MPTKIEWTHMPGYKGETWNPVRGCTKVSPGCARCYAEAIDLRFKRGGGPFLPGKATITAREELLEVPLRWKAPRMVFTCSMSDLFHEEISAEFIGRCFGVMSFASRHIFLVLTKRAERMHELLTSSGAFSNAMYSEYGRLAIQGGWDRVGSGWPPKNIWLGVSVENQHWANIRIPFLLGTPAAVRFLSLEPLLKEVHLDDFLKVRKHWLKEDGISEPPWHLPYPAYWYEKQGLVLAGAPTLHWLIVGGESGPKARRMDLAWARHLRDQAKAAGVAFFAKQLGTAWAIENGGRRNKGDAIGEFPEDLQIREWPER